MITVQIRYETLIIGGNFVSNFRDHIRYKTLVYFNLYLLEACTISDLFVKTIEF